MSSGRRRALLVALTLTLAAGGTAAQPSYGDLARQGIDPASRLSRASSELESARRRVTEAQSEEARASTEIKALVERAADARASIRDRVRALYRVRRAGNLPIAGGIPALLAHASRVERLERIVRADVDAVRYLDERREGLEVEASRARRLREAAEREVRSLESQRRAVEDEMRAYGYAPDGFLPNLPVVSIPESAQGMAAFGGMAPAGFAAQRGTLEVPVRAATRIRDAVRDDGPGIELLSPAGADVVAAAEGRVAFARAYGSYGRVVILDHEGSYYTVYGGLGRIDARVGDTVGRGEVVGTVGAAPTPALFFEVRHGTRSLDARAWLRP